MKYFPKHLVNSKKSSIFVLQKEIIKEIDKLYNELMLKQKNYETN